MTQIDFYVLPETTSQARWLFACRLCEKALRANMTTLLVVDTQAEAEALDTLLWTFKPESFVPHQLLPANAPTASPAAPSQNTSAQAYIVNAQQALPPMQTECFAAQGLLINLSAQLPAYYPQFARLAELVIQVPEALAKSRERFTVYKSQGYAINTHKI